MLVLLLIVLLCRGSVTLRCDRQPNGVTSPRQTANFPFGLRVESVPPADQPDALPRPASSFLPGHDYVVSLGGDEQQSPVHRFMDFMLTVESATGLETGSFSPSGNTFTKFSERCRNAVVQTSSMAKLQVSAYWRAPAPGNGCVVFRASVVEMRDVWYMDDGPLSLELCEELTIDEAGPAILDPCCACDEAKYEMAFEGLWSRHTHPKEFPKDHFKAKFSDVIGASHMVNYRFWNYGEFATEGLKELAEEGSTRTLESELKEKSQHIRTIIKARGISYPNVIGRTFAVFRVDNKNHLMTVVSKISPSPDWIVGVSGLELCLPNCSWIEKQMVELYPWDAGTDNGITYESDDSPSIPAEPIVKITSNTPNDPLSPFYDEAGEDMKPLAILSVTRQRLYEKDSCENSVEPEREDNCAVSEWSEWSPCSASCGEGRRMRRRSFLDPARGRAPRCRVSLTSRTSCVAAPCRDRDRDRQRSGSSSRCQLSEWSDWSRCSATCGWGFYTRTRHYLQSRAGYWCARQPGAPRLEETERCDGEESCRGEEEEAGEDEEGGRDGEEEGREQEEENDVEENRGDNPEEDAARYNEENGSYKEEGRGYGEKDRGYGEDDRGYGEEDRGYGEDDRGHGEDDRGHGEDDRGHGEEDRGYGEDDRGYGEDDKGHGEDDRGHGEEDRGYGEEDRGYGEEDRYRADEYGRENEDVPEDSWNNHLGKDLNHQSTDSLQKSDEEDPECPRMTEWTAWSTCSVSCGRGTRMRNRYHDTTDFNTEMIARVMRGEDDPGQDDNATEDGEECDTETLQEEECEGPLLSCDPPTEQQREICLMEKDKGPCYNTEIRWYFDKETLSCQQFEYGGCRGNRNKFNTQEACEQMCAGVTAEETTTERGPFGGLVAGNQITNLHNLGLNAPTYPYVKTARNHASITSLNGRVIDCVVSPWSHWSACSASCGPGHKNRTRTIKVSPVNGGKACPEKLLRRKKCRAAPCDQEYLNRPLHRRHSEEVNHVDMYGNSLEKGALSEEEDEEEVANEILPLTSSNEIRTSSEAIAEEIQAQAFQRPPFISIPKSGEIDCELSQWTAWSSCSMTCGTNAYRQRTRSILTQPSGEGLPCGKRIEVQLCALRPCRPSQ